MLKPEQLRQFPIFNNLPEGDLLALATSITRRSYPKNASIFHPGDVAETTYLIESGMVRIYLLDSRGREFLINLLRPGAAFGHPLNFEAQTRVLGTITQLPSVILSLSHENLLKIARSSPQLSLNLFADMASSMKKLLLHYCSSVSAGLEGRTAALLLHIHEEQRQEIYLPVNQSILASWLGVSRGRLSTTLIKFQKTGLIGLEGSRILILHQQGLMAIAERAGDE